ncbi:MAG: DUF3291 domain-containing protein [Actinobacteria bacterium]|nr:DUF3291 domain-containing protein [Actinomycetota bacterium]
MHLASFNIARLHHPIDHPASKGFIDLIDETNARAEAGRLRPAGVWPPGSPRGRWSRHEYRRRP